MSYFSKKEWKFKKFQRSNTKNKKYDAIIENKETGREKRIPFGDKSKILEYVNAKHPLNRNPGWYDYGIPSDLENFNNIKRQWSNQTGLHEHTKTTHILSAFQLFNDRFYQSQDRRDYFIFFISPAMFT